MIRLIHGEAIEEMQKLIQEGVKVDAVITDPPQGKTACKWDVIIPFNEHVIDKRGKILYLNDALLKGYSLEWFNENKKPGMWECIKGLRKDRTPVVLFGNEPYSSMLRISNLKEYKYDWYWEKSTKTGFINAKKMPLKSIETISLFYKKRVLYIPQGLIENKQKLRKNSFDKMNKTRKGISTHNGGRFKNYKYEQQYTNYPNTLLKFRSNVGFHSTQKPVPLMEYLIKTYTKEGDTVLDFTFGSGSTAIACLNLNRNFIGIEKDKEIFDIGKKRIMEEERKSA